jgi:hypothetical protein
MSVTFNQPLRVYKYNNPTNNGVIAPDNTGVAQISQVQSFANITATTSGAVILPMFNIGQTTATPVTIPAGAIIDNFTLYQTSAPSALTGGVITVYVNATAVGTITPTTSGGQIQFVPTNSTTAAAALALVGTVDATITYSQATISAITGTLGGVIKVDYVARNFDGSITNVGQGYTNT